MQELGELGGSESRHQSWMIDLKVILFMMKEKVYEFVKTIPKGKVVTYGQIAMHLGNKNLARVVGNILHNNPDPKNVPCHRVVNCNGRLAASYAFGGSEAQRALLASEGVVFKNNGHVDLKVSQMTNDEVGESYEYL